MDDGKPTLKNQLSGLQKKYSDIEETNKNLNDQIIELHSLYQISLALSMTLELEEILKSIKKFIKKSFDVDQYSILLIDKETNELKINSSFGLNKAHTNEYSKFNNCIFDVAFKAEKSIYVPDITNEIKFDFYHSNNIKNGSFISIPLQSNNDVPLGVLNLYNENNNSFSTRRIKLFSKIATQIAKVVDKTILFEQTKELSITDELTDIYNRRYFNQRFEREVIRAKRYKRPLTLVLIDIDYFKNYNDLNGHLLGDKVLEKVARLLEVNIRKADILARFGGEEFVVLLPEINKDRAFNVAEKLRQAIDNNRFPEEYKQPNHKLTISVGLATLLEDTYTSEELIHFADKALYKAKALGRNQVIGYFPDLNIIDDQPVYPLNSMAISPNLN